MRPTDPFRSLAALLVLASCTSAPAFAQEDTPRPAEARPDQDKVEEKEEGEDPEQAKPKPGPVLAIVGADIETVTKGTIRRGTILVRDGKILAVGQSVEVPEGAEVIDAAGKVVTPGFVSVDMNGVGVGPAASSRGGGPNSNKVADALDPFDRNMKFCLGVGITAGAVQVGGSSGSRFFFEPGPDSAGREPIELTVDDLIGLHADGQLDDETFRHLISHDDGHGHADGHADTPLGLFAGGEGPGMASPFDARFFSAQDRAGTCEHCSATVMETLPPPRAPPPPPAPPHGSGAG
jgi:hypothetical protein